MGIPGLATQNKNVYKSSTNVSIIEAAAEYRRQHPEKTPEILIDGSNFIYQAYDKIIKSKLWGGAEIKKATDSVLKFFNRLEENNINYKIFFDEYLPESRIPIKIKRNNKRHKDIEKTFAALDGGKRHNYRASIIGFSYFLQYHLIGLKKRAILTTKERRRQNDEIMDYVSKFGCFGVISDDTDFMICEGIPYLFSMEYCNMDTMRTMYTNRDKLAKAIGIEPRLLPYFAALCGNDIVSKDMLLSFHSALRTNNKDKFSAVAGWLNENCSTRLDDDLSDYITQLIGIPHLASKIKDCVRCYNIRRNQESSNPEYLTTSEDWNRTLNQAFDRLKNGLLDCEIFRIMSDRLLLHGAGLEIYNDDRYPCDVVIARSMYRRLYGLLLADYPAELGRKEVKEILFTKLNSMNTPSLVSPIFPDPKVTLAELWNPDCSVDLKWKILCWIVDPTINHKELQEVPEALRVPALAIHLLISAKGTNEADWAIEGLISQAVLLLKATLTEINRVRYNQEHSKSVHYSNVYNKLCVAIYNISGACGAPTAIYHHLDVPFFDAKLYNNACVEIYHGRSGIIVTGKNQNPYVIKAYSDLKKFLNWK